MSASDIALLQRFEQAETLLWLVQGESNKGIAQKMGIKLTTVKRNLEAIYGQLKLVCPGDVPGEEMRLSACRTGKSWLADHDPQVH